MQRRQTLSAAALVRNRPVLASLLPLLRMLCFRFCFRFDIATRFWQGSHTIVREKIAKVMVVFTLICAIGGHWAILQSVAWVGMAVKYSQGSTFTEALVKTFDGKHPCKICKVVQEGQKSEQKHTSLKVETRIDFWLARASFLLDAPPPFVVLPAEPGYVELRAESPPTPPPRWS